MMFELKVPYLPQPKIENAANELLRKYGKWKGIEVKPPINIDDIIDDIIEGYFGLGLTFCNLEEQLGMPDVLGATWFEDKHIKIASSLEDKEGRMVFTMAHETGHWWLHQPIIEMEKVTLPLFSKDDGMPATPALVCRSSKKPPAEWQADQFAACLLMQASAVRGTVLSMYGESLPAWDDVQAKRKAKTFDPKLRDLAADVIRTGEFSNVSNEVMRYRLLDLKLVRDLSDPQQSLL